MTFKGGYDDTDLENSSTGLSQPKKASHLYLYRVEWEFRCYTAHVLDVDWHAHSFEANDRGFSGDLWSTIPSIYKDLRRLKSEDRQ